MRNKIFVDGREMSIAKFEAASGLIVSVLPALYGAPSAPGAALWAGRSFAGGSPRAH